MGFDDFAKEVREKAEGVVNQVQEKSPEVTEKAKELFGQAQEKAPEVFEQVKESAGVFVENAKEVAADAGQKVQDVVGDIKSQGEVVLDQDGNMVHPETSQTKEPASVTETPKTSEEKTK